VLTPPICNAPVGLGAKRTLTSRINFEMRSKLTLIIHWKNFSRVNQLAVVKKEEIYLIP
jgi:hypothetical protein